MRAPLFDVMFEITIVLLKVLWSQEQTFAPYNFIIPRHVKVSARLLAGLGKLKINGPVIECDDHLTFIEKLDELVFGKLN